MQRRGFLHVQNVASKCCILIADGLFHVLLTIPNFVTLFVHPCLVAISFGLSEQLSRSGSSNHLGHAKSSRRYVTGCWPTPARVGDEKTRGGRMLKKRELEGEASVGWAPNIKSLRPSLDVELRDRVAVEQQQLVEGPKWEPCRRGRCEWRAETRDSRGKGARRRGATRTQTLTWRG